ncbi:MAG TPA: hypothetical protein VHN99_11520 [Deinococcales bacterium]|nr:hypothetical protein [Deinococcales bacterium]
MNPSTLTIAGRPVPARAFDAQSQDDPQPFTARETALLNAAAAVLAARAAPDGPLTLIESYRGLADTNPARFYLRTERGAEYWMGIGRRAGLRGGFIRVREPQETPAGK